MLFQRPLRWLTALPLLAVGCLPATNAYDPNTPVELQARGSISGDLRLAYTAPTTSIVQARLDALAVVLTNVGSGDDESSAIRATCAEALSCDADAGTAAFSFADLVPGTYRLGVEDPPTGLLDPTGGRSLVIELSAGEAYTEPTLVFTEPVINTDDEGQGVVTGRVVVDAGAANPTVTAYQIVGTSAVQRRQAPTLPDGTFRLEGLPAGDYAIAAEADGFTPDFSTSVPVLDEELALEDDLVLFAGTAVLNPDVQQVFGAYYTREDTVPVQVLAFGGMTEMRVWSGETPPETFVAYSAATAVALPDVQGAITLSAQFRLTTDDGVVFTTEVFTGEVVRDTAPPEVIDALIVGKTPAADGVVYSTTEGETISVDVAVNDVTSAAYSIDVIEGPADMPPAADAFAFENTFLPGGYVEVQETIGLSAGEGDKALWLGVRDRAENVVVDGPLFITVDTEAPQLGDAGGGVAPIEVLEVVDSVLGTRTATVRVNLGPSTSDVASVVVGQKPLATNAAATVYGPGDTYEPDTAVTVEGEHADMVAFVARVTDFAGNTEEVETLELLLSLTGVVAGRALLDETPADALVHAGTTVSLWRSGRDPDVDPPDHQTVTDETGAFVIPDVVEGTNVRIRYTRPGADAREDLVGEVVAGETVLLPTVLLPVSRGNITGVFQRQGITDPLGHGGILVEALFGGVVVAITVTEPNGDYRFPFPGVPVTVGTDRYTVRGSAEGYLPQTQTAIQVTADTDTVVDPDGNGDPQAALLLRETGDFTLCAETGPCVSAPYTSSTTMRIAIPGDDSDVTDVRFRARDAFADNDADPAWSGSYTPGGTLLVDLSGPDGVVEVFLQLERSGVQGPVLRASIILDTVPPTVESVVIADGPDAALSGFTNASQIDVQVNADAGGSNTAPIQEHFIVFADAQPGALPVGAESCALGGCRIDLPDGGSGVEERLHTLWAYSCDAAGNCAVAGVAGQVVYDITDPTALNGAGFAAVGANLNTVGMVTYTGARDFLIELDVGAARTGGDVEVLDPAGTAVSDVAAYRFKSVFVGAGVPPTSTSFAGVPWTPIDASPGDTVPGIASPSLLGGEGVYRVFAELRDGAGNVSEIDPADFFIDVTLDTEDPAAQFTIQPSGFTREPHVQLLITSSSNDPVVRAEIALDDGLFESVLSEDITGQSAMVPFDLSQLPLAGADGVYTVSARLYDAAGNSTLKDASVTLDTTPPVAQGFSCSNCVAADGALYVGGLDVLFDVLATDALGDVVSVVLTVDGVPQAADGYDGTTAAQLPGGTSGPVVVTASFEDSAGNLSLPGAETTLTVVVDNAVNDPTLLINNGDAFATDLLGQVLLSIATPDTDIVDMRIGNEGSFGGWQPYVENVVWTVAQPNVEGTKTVDVEVRDAAGNVGSDAASITLDLAAPVGTISIDGAPYATSASVTLDMTHPSDVGEVAIVNSPNVDCGAAAYNASLVTLGTTATSDVGHTLSAGEGAKFVTVCFRDQAGQTSAASAEIILDLTAPSGTVQIENGAAFTQTADVDLYLTAPSDIADVAFGDAAMLDCSTTTAWEAYAAVKTTVLTAGDGLKAVKVCFRDAAGLIAEAIDDITLDTSNPGGTVVIDAADATHTRDREVNLILTDPDGDIVSIAVGDGTSLDCASASYVPFTTTLPYALPPGDGAKSVTVCFEDSAGRQSSATDSILLDTSPPAGSIVINGGEDYANSLALEVTLTFPSDVTHYDVGFGLLDCELANYEPVQGSPSFTETFDGTVPPADGSKTLSACFQDAAGWKTGASDEIILDRTDPTANIQINGGDPITTSRDVNAVYTVSPDVAEYVISTSAIDCETTGAYGPYTTDEETVQLLDVDGPQFLIGCFRDLAGNSTAVTSTVILDRVAPSVGLVAINGGDATTTDTGVLVDAVINNAPAVTEVTAIQLSEAPDFAGAAWLDYAAGDAYSLVLSSDNGVKTVYVRVRDEAGNVSDGSVTTEDEDTIVLDNQSPDITSVSISTVTNAAVLSVNVQAEDNVSGVSELEVRWSVDDTTPCAGLFDDSVGAASVTLPATEGFTVVRVCVRDGAGNTRQTGQGLLVDRSPPPTPPAPTLVGGSRRFDAAWVDLGDAASPDGPSGIEIWEVQVASTNAFLDTLFVDETTTNSTTIAGPSNGTQYWTRVRAFDRAGNVSGWSTGSPVLVGLSGAVTPGNFSLLGPDYTNPTTMVAKGVLYTALNDADALGADTGGIKMNVCRIANDNCRHPDNWDTLTLSPTTLGAGWRLVSRRIPMLHYDNRLWAAGAYASGPNVVVHLHACIDSADCTRSASWTDFSASVGAADVRAESIGLAGGGTNVAVGWAENGTQLKVVSCAPNNENCDTALDFGTQPQITDSVSPDDFKLSLAASEQLVAATYKRSPFEIGAAVCPQQIGCDDGFTVFGVSQGGVDTTYDHPSIAFVDDFLYITYTRIFGPSFQVYATRCDTRLDCFDPFAWSSPSMIFETTGPFDQVTLGAGRNTLYASWWNGALGAVELGICELPGADFGEYPTNDGGCAAAENWRRLVVDDVVNLETEASVVEIGGVTPVVAYMSGLSIKVVLPSVAPVMDHAVVAGVGQASQRWSARFDQAGYEQLYGGTPAAWANEVALADPSLSNANVLIAPTGETPMSIRAVNDTGQRSDDALVFRVTPHTLAAPDVSTGVTTSSRCVPNIGGVDCYIGSADTDERWMLAAYASFGSVLQAFSVCDEDEADCGAGGDYSGESLGSLGASMLGTQTKIVRDADGDAWGVLMFHSARRAQVWTCNLSGTGCRTVGDWTEGAIIDNGGGEDVTPQLAHIPSTNALFVVHRNAVGNLTFANCDVRDCTSWDAAVGGSVDDRGLAVDARDGAVAAVALDSAALVMQRFDGVVRPRQTVRTTASPFNDQLRLALAPERQVIVEVSNTLRVYSCPYQIASCISPTTWSVIDLGPVPGNDGIGVDVVQRGGVVQVATVTGRQVQLSWCSGGDCSVESNWVLPTTAFRDQRLKPFASNARFLRRANGSRRRCVVRGAARAPRPMPC
jgi:hypothetical protein